jgi:hypothetical protein
MNRNDTEADMERAKMARANDDLRDAIFRAYAVSAKVADDGRYGSEQERRENALAGIDEIFRWRPLAAFSATRLELLETLVSFWLEGEDAGEVRAPPPDPIS